MNNKPEWMQFDTNNIPRPALSSGESDDVYIGYEKGWNDALLHFLKHLQKNSWYTKAIPQGKGQRIISKRVGISQEFVEAMIKELADYK